MLLKNCVALAVGVLLMAHLKGQVYPSHQGFYASDSLFFELSGTDSFEYCINCYAESELKSYAGGVWLYSRQKAPNTWENSLLTTPESDSKRRKQRKSGVRPNVVKGNTVWVRTYRYGGYTDKHYTVYLGTYRPKTEILISLHIDTADFIGDHGLYGPGVGSVGVGGQYLWNFSLPIQKPVYYEVFRGPGLLYETSQAASLALAARNSAVLPNKGLALTPLNETDTLNLGNTLATQLGPNIKNARIRVATNDLVFGNELVLTTIQPEIGGTVSVPVCVFINGSFWTYGQIHETLNRHRIAKIMNTTPNNLIGGTVGCMPFEVVEERAKEGAAFRPVTETVYDYCDPRQGCYKGVFCHNELVTYKTFFKDSTNDTEIQQLCDLVLEQSAEKIAEGIDKVNLLRYALSNWFFQQEDSWTGNALIAKMPGKPWQIFVLQNNFGLADPNVNDWKRFFFEVEPDRRCVPWKLARKLFDIDRDFFCLLLQDELNTTYLPARTLQIMEEKRTEVRRYTKECSRAWTPAVWPDSTAWENQMHGLTDFLNERPNAIAGFLPGIFLGGEDGKLTLKDRHRITINPDTLYPGEVMVKLNSLELTGSYTGVYYPKPGIRLQAEFDHSKYRFVRWEGLPGAEEKAEVFLDKDVTVTPVIERLP